MSIPDKAKKMIAITNLLAIKENETSGWKFIDTNNISDEEMDTILPEFKNKVKIPQKLFERPLVIPKEEVPETVTHILNILDQTIKKVKAKKNNLQ